MCRCSNGRDMKWRYSGCCTTVTWGKLYETGRRGSWQLGSGYGRRLLKAVEWGRFDAMICEQEMLPFPPAFAELWLQRRESRFAGGAGGPGSAGGRRESVAESNDCGIGKRGRLAAALDR